jgi:hypothetical protein
VRFGNSPVIEGRDAVVASFRQFYDSIAAMRHEREFLISDGDTVCSQAIVTYTRLDGADVSLPVASCLHRTPEGLLDRLYIYIDIAPVFAAAA